MCMKKIEMVSVWEQYDHEDELAAIDRTLLEEAKKAQQQAYAPYSTFRVGAALLLEDGSIVWGNNQENVAYPSGMCAERTALYACGANNPGMRIIAMAVIAGSENFTLEDIVSPCGACRQVISEYENMQNTAIRIIMKGDPDMVLICSGIDALLPLAFKCEPLVKK